MLAEEALTRRMGILSAAMWEGKKVNELTGEIQESLDALLGRRCKPIAEWETPEQRLLRAGINPAAAGLN